MRLPRKIESQKFNGRMYNRESSGYNQSSKKSAKKYADSLRAKGMLVRVVPWKKHNLYLVYSTWGRKKKKK